MSAEYKELQRELIDSLRAAPAKSAGQQRGGSKMHTWQQVPQRESAQRLVYPAGVNFDRFQGPTADDEAREDALVNIEREEAYSKREMALRNAHLISEFISEHCFGSVFVRFPPLSRNGLDLGCDLELADVRQLVCLLMHDRADVRAAASDQLRKRYEDYIGAPA